MKIHIGTRGSKLALAQTNLVIEELQKHNENLEIELVIIKTKGDKIQETSLDKIGDKGLFVKEIEKKLLNSSIDLAVHSMKDVPYDIVKNLKVLPVLKRANPVDVLITPHPINHISELPKNAVIATGSKRRSAQLHMFRPDIRIQPIRGNVENRIKKMLYLGYDGTILAAAGIERLGIVNNNKIYIIPFKIDEMIPAPAQGIIGVEYRSRHKKLEKLIKKIVDKKTLLQCNAERFFLKKVNGGCHLPMGAYLECGLFTTFYGLFGDENCEIIRSMKLNGKLEDGHILASKVAKILLDEVNR